MIPEYLNVMVNGVPLVIVVIGLTYLYGLFGAKGKVQLALSFATGLAAGAGWVISQSGLPATFAGWFGCVVFALAMGLLPSGIYEAMKGAAAKGLLMAVEEDEPEAKSEETSDEDGGER